MIDFLLLFSAVLNVFFIWYVIKLLRRFLAFQDELDEFSLKLEEYTGHIDIIYNLETFYGDTTLKNLLMHSKSVAEECKQFQSFLTGQEDEEDAEKEKE
jgi:hypothetical protein|tara:strand:+ start:485 stop:781 length:297 start_codon:yes stop_codon:yes gene_type:complete